MMSRLKFNLLLKSTLVALLLVLGSGPFSAVHADGGHPVPVMDGAFTSDTEYNIPGVVRVADLCSTGDLFYYTRANRAGVFSIVTHAMYVCEAEVDDGRCDDSLLYDGNNHSWYFPWGEKITAWLFQDGDSDYDEQCMTLMEIPYGNDPDPCPYVDYVDENYQIRDEGFIVRRVYQDTTEWGQYLPGDPIPGDPDFDPAEYFGFFGMAGFNNSGFANGYLRENPEYPDAENKNYEFCLKIGPYSSPKALRWLDQMGGDFWDFLYACKSWNGEGGETKDFKLQKDKGPMAHWPAEHELLENLEWAVMGRKIPCE